ncbi:hypothetical protein E2C01_075400 [Portunus trituberculatus]|uniref:Uncharacterized protein n=1 Tax=Portunus trituberculatus TaxID=210409 RepID=A0A5B7IGY9_PORTR|nr:hypothetical protein [Portunus trituberculatus]
MGASVASSVQITHTQICSFVSPPPQHLAGDEIRRLLHYTDSSQAQKNKEKTKADVREALKNGLPADVSKGKRRKKDKKEEKDEKDEEDEDKEEGQLLH